jgi:hypothetical protein
VHNELFIVLYYVKSSLYTPVFTSVLQHCDDLVFSLDVVLMWRMRNQVCLHHSVF